MSNQKMSWKHAQNVAWRKVEDEVVILDLETSVYYSLNSTASRIWELLGEGMAEDDIVEKVSDEYNQSEKVVKKDMTGLIQKMKKEKLLVPQKH
ncbi:MAG TPA: PqqD family protein [Elusimicrobiota bacterium]|nr:PqqD family protein [Elusimicrobiota bacterium]